MPDPSRLKSNEWEGVVQNQLKLQELFLQYITRPLTEQAEQLVLTSVAPECDEQLQQQNSSDGQRLGQGQGGPGLLPPSLGWLEEHYAAIAITAAMVALGSLVVWRAVKSH